MTSVAPGEHSQRKEEHLEKVTHREALHLTGGKFGNNPAKIRGKENHPGTPQEILSMVQPPITTIMMDSTLTKTILEFNLNQQS